jgi:hypothetical protein
MEQSFLPWPEKQTKRDITSEKTFLPVLRSVKFYNVFKGSKLRGSCQYFLKQHLFIVQNSINQK